LTLLFLAVPFLRQKFEGTFIHQGSSDFSPL